MTENRKIIAVASEDDRGLESQVCPHFGHCPTFTLVELHAGRISDVRVETNPLARSHSPGSLPAHVRSLGAEVMLAGGMGQRAVAFFREMGIEACAGYEGPVREAVEDYLNGDSGGAEPCAGHGGGGCHD
jgi:predicted Fe-Mo cluster-binding NifX family protein